jgi:hypothetical protein
MKKHHYMPEICIQTLLICPKHSKKHAPTIRTKGTSKTKHEADHGQIKKRHPQKFGNERKMNERGRFYPDFRVQFVDRSQFELVTMC